MKRIKALFLWCILTIISLLFIENHFYSSYKLKKTTQEDIEFIHKTIFENHPGPYNNQDPEFIHNMDIAYSIAKNAINLMKTSQDHLTIIKQYLASFHDTHVRLYPKKQEPEPSTVYEYKHFSIKEIFPNCAWITLPTFAPDKEQQKELELIIDQISQYRRSNLIVFDVRDNTGGNSQWGTKILENLFGKYNVTECLYNMNKNVEVDWRASKDNTAYLSKLTTYIVNQFGQNSQEESYFKAIEEGVRNAYDKNQTFYTEHTKSQATSSCKMQNLVTAQIVVITSSQNVSACLDFIDEIKDVDPEAILIGQTTDADSVYMEVRTIDVPSCIGTLQFPIKMYRNRHRGHNVPYVPDIAYPENIISKEDKDQWLLETIHSLYCFEHDFEFKNR